MFIAVFFGYKAQNFLYRYKLVEYQDQLIIFFGIIFRKECGIEKFVPYSHLEQMKPKELRKILGNQMKINQNLTPPGQKHLSSMQAKLHYMKIVTEQKTFGSRVFMVTLLVSGLSPILWLYEKSSSFVFKF